MSLRTYLSVQSMTRQIGNYQTKNQVMMAPSLTIEEKDATSDLRGWYFIMVYGNFHHKRLYRFHLLIQTIQSLLTTIVMAT